MKFLSLIVCVATIALFVPACATAPKKQECAKGDSCCASDGAGKTPAKKH